MSGFLGLLANLDVWGVGGVDGHALGHQYPHVGRQVPNLGQWIPVRLQIETLLFWAGTTIPFKISIVADLVLSYSRMATLTLHFRQPYDIVQKKPDPHQTSYSQKKKDVKIPAFDRASWCKIMLLKVKTGRSMAGEKYVAEPNAYAKKYYEREVS